MTRANSAQSVDPAIVAYLGATMALLKLWDTESRRIATVVYAEQEDDATDQPTPMPSVHYLEAIRATVTTLSVPYVCQGVQQAFVQAMDQGLHTYQSMLESADQAEQRVAMLSGVENFAHLDAELARLEQQFGPFDEAP